MRIPKAITDGRAPTAAQYNELLLLVKSLIPRQGEGTRIAWNSTGVAVSAGEYVVDVRFDTAGTYANKLYYITNTGRVGIIDTTEGCDP